MLSPIAALTTSMQTIASYEPFASSPALLIQTFPLQNPPCPWRLWLSRGLAKSLSCPTLFHCCALFPVSLTLAKYLEKKPSRAEENPGSRHSFPGKEEQPWVHFSKPTSCCSPHKQIRCCQRWRWQQLLGAVLGQSESSQEPPWGQCQASFASHEDYQLTHLCKHTARCSSLDRCHIGWERLQITGSV